MKAKKKMYVNGGKAPIVPDPKKKVVIPAPKKKTGMDAVKALGEYVTTFGFAKEGYNPNPKKTTKKK